MTADYVRIAASVSDPLYVDEAKAVAFRAIKTESEILAFVNDPSNEHVVFDMLDEDSGFRTIDPSSNRTQRRVVAYVTRDADDVPIAIGNTYHTYGVTKNRGRYQAIIA